MEFKDNIEGIAVTMLLSKVISDTRNNSSIPMVRSHQLHHAKALMEGLVESNLYLLILERLESVMIEMLEPIIPDFVEFQVVTQEKQDPELTPNNKALTDSEESGSLESSIDTIGTPGTDPEELLQDNPLQVRILLVMFC